MKDLIEKLEHAKIHLGAVNGDFVGDDEEWHNKGIDKAIAIVRQHEAAMEDSGITDSAPSGQVLPNKTNKAGLESSTNTSEIPVLTRQPTAADNGKHIVTSDKPVALHYLGESTPSDQQRSDTMPFRRREAFSDWYLKNCHQYPSDEACVIFEAGWNARLPEPVSVSLEKCYAAFKTERSLLYMPDGTTVEDIDWKKGIRAVLDAAGVKYE